MKILSTKETPETAMLPDRCNHNGVGHTNQNSQKLLDNHGSNQTLQGRDWKNNTVFL